MVGLFRLLQILLFLLVLISLLGSRVPIAAKVFLTTLAVVDDLIAIVIIAVAYTESFNFLFMGGALAVLIALIVLNKRGIIAPWPYILLGIVLWLCIFKSGLHATMAGVILAMTIPTKGSKQANAHSERSMAEQIAAHSVPSVAEQSTVSPRDDEDDEINPLMDWHHALGHWITFLIVPLLVLSMPAYRLENFNLVTCNILFSWVLL